MSKLTVKFTVVVFLLEGIFMQAKGQVKSEYTQIINKFEQWKAIQYKKGTYETEKRCNIDSVSKESYKGSGMGIPKDINIFFTDINHDNKLDALFTFNPDQCDGGNALMNAQIRVLILSNGSTYITDDNFIDKIESKLKKGWLNIERVNDRTFYGTYYEYKDTDGRCCPSVRRPVQIDYKTKILTFLNDD